MISSSSRRATMFFCWAALTLIQVGPLARRARAQVQRPAAPDQSRRPIDAELRVDGIAARISAVHAGIGVTMPNGNYLRSGIVAGLGFSRDGWSGRIDAMSRFHFDPFRQSRWAPYGGGGISGRFERAERAHVYLLLLVGLDGPAREGFAPSFELGLGGGARLGVIVRQATGERR